MFYRSKLIVIALLMTAVVLLVNGAMNQRSRLIPEPSFAGSTVYPASLNGLLAGCGQVFDFDTEVGNYGMIPDNVANEEMPVLRVRVPAYGYMSSDAVAMEDVKAYPRDFEGFSLAEIHRIMWQGVDIVWADSGLTDEAYVFASNFVSDWNETEEKQLMLLPWPAEAGPLPQDRSVAYASWGTTQTCDGFSETVFNEFEDFVASDVSGKGDRDYGNPPVAPLNDEGGLRPVFAEQE